jgi:hypothetical protein
MKTRFLNTENNVWKIAVLLSCPRLKLATRADFARFLKDAFPELMSNINDIMSVLATHLPYVSDDFITPPMNRPFMAWWTISNPSAPEWLEDGCCGLCWNIDSNTWLRASDGQELRQASGGEIKIRVWCELPK